MWKWLICCWNVVRILLAVVLRVLACEQVSAEVVKAVLREWLLCIPHSPKWRVSVHSHYKLLLCKLRCDYAHAERQFILCQGTNFTARVAHQRVQNLILVSCGTVKPVYTIMERWSDYTGQ